MAKRSTIRGYTLFCDDIRQEIGGKLSIMGLYQTHLHISPGLPAVLPKFSMYIQFRLFPEESKEDFSLKVFFETSEDVLLLEQTVPYPEEVAAEPMFEPDSFHLANLIINLAPFEIKEAGRLKVRMYQSGLEYKLGSLVIDVATP